MSYITQREQRCLEQRYVLNDGNESMRRRSEARPPSNRLNSSEDGSSWNICANVGSVYLLDYVYNLKTHGSENTAASQTTCKEPSSKSFGMQAGDAEQDFLRLKENEYLKRKLADYEDRLSKYQSQLAKLTECGAFNMPREIMRLEKKLLICQPYKEQIEIYKREVFLLKRHCKALQNVKEENDSLSAQLTASYEREGSSASSLSSHPSNSSSELSMNTCQLKKLVTDLRKTVSNLNSVKRERDLLRQEVKRLNIKVKEVDEHYYGELLCLRKRSQSLDIIIEQRNSLQSLLFRYDSVDEMMKKLIEKAKDGDKVLEERNSLVNQLNLMKSDYDECKRASDKSSETITVLTSSMKAMATDRDMLLRKIQENEYLEMKLEALKSSFREQSLNLQITKMERDMFRCQCQRLAAYVKRTDTSSKGESQQQDAACQSFSKVSNEMQMERDDAVDMIFRKVTPKQRKQIETKHTIDEQIETPVSLLKHTCRGNCPTGNIRLKMEAGMEEPSSYIKKPSEVKDTTEQLKVTERQTCKADSPKGIVYDRVRDLFKRLAYFREHNGEIEKQRDAETQNEIQMSADVKRFSTDKVSTDKEEIETDKLSTDEEFVSTDMESTAKKAIETAELAFYLKRSRTDIVLVGKEGKETKESVNEEKGVSTDTAEICKVKREPAELPAAVKVATHKAIDELPIDEQKINNDQVSKKNKKTVEQLLTEMSTANQIVVMAIVAQKKKEEEHVAFTRVDKTEEPVIKKLVTIFEKTAHINDRKSKSKPVEFIENKLLTANELTKLNTIPPTKQEEYDLLKVISNFKNQLEDKSGATLFPSTTSTVSPVKTKLQSLTNQLSTAERKVKDLEVELAKLKEQGKKREANMNANLALEEDANIMQVQKLTEATKKVNEIANENTRLKSDNKKMLNDFKDLRRRLTAMQAELDTLKHHYETKIEDLVKVHERNINSIENVHKNIIEETLLARKINEEKLSSELASVRRNCICTLTKTNRDLKRMVNRCLDVKHSKSIDVKFSEKKCSCPDAQPDEDVSQSLVAAAVAEIIAKISSEGLEGLNFEELRILHSETCKVIASIRWFKVKRQKRSRTASNSRGRSQTSQKFSNQRSVSAEHKSCPCLKKIKRNYREHLVNQDIAQEKLMDLQCTLHEDKLLIEKIRDSKISCKKENQEFYEKYRGKNYQRRTNLPLGNLAKTDAARRCKATQQYISTHPEKEMRKEKPLVCHCSENNISDKKSCGKNPPNAHLEGGSKIVQQIYMAYSTRSNVAEIDDKTSDFINNIKYQSSSKIL